MPITYRPSLWTRDELLATCQGELVGGDPSDWKVEGVSRRVQTAEPGDVFFATAEDGDEPMLAAVPELVRRGVTACVVSGPIPPETPSFGRIVRVDSAHQALVRLAQAGRARTEARIVGVTGSYGKTGVKDAIAHVLGRQVVTYANYRNDNCGWGLPGALAGIPPRCGVGVFEMGMLARGSIRSKALLVQPHVAIITAIGAAHLYKHETIESIVDTKSEIVDGLVEGGTHVVPRDSPYFERLLDRARTSSRCGRIVTFGRHTEADVRVIDEHVRATYSEARFRLPSGKELAAVISLAGAHWVSNAACVLAAALALDADVEAASLDLATLTPSLRRGERFRVELEQNEIVELVDDTWNASPSSVEAALAQLARMTPAANGRRILVLGDMLELGSAERDLHAGLAPSVIAARADVVHTVGDRMRHLREALPAERRGEHWQSARRAAAQIPSRLQHGDVLLVKGSNGMDMWRIVHALVPNRAQARPITMHWRVADEVTSSGKA